MQEDENQSEQEMQPSSGNGSEENQPEPEPQPTSKQAEESKFEQEKQPPSQRRADESQPEQEKHPPSERERGWSEYEWNRYKGETEGSEYKPQQTSSEKERGESQPRLQQQSPSERGASQSQPRPRLRAPPATPVPPPLTEQQKRRQYFLGLGWGLIPLIFFLILGGFARAMPGETFIILFGPFLLGIVLYVIELTATIVCLANARQRFVGYGLLTAFLATPIVAVIGCYVIISA